jgi:hypothetical protein
MSSSSPVGLSATGRVLGEFGRDCERASIPLSGMNVGRDDVEDERVTICKELNIILTNPILTKID